MSAVLAVDLGGSALKACLYDMDGGQTAAASVPLSFEEDPTGRSEQDPAVWWDAFSQVVEDIASTEAGAAGLGDVTAIAICGFTRTQVFLDSGNRVLRPAIGFRDSRALGPAEQALSCKAVATQPDAGNLNAFHPLARLLWLKHNEPQAWAATRLVLEPKDYLNLRLTGQAMSDRISQHWLYRAIRQGAPSLAALAGIDRDVLPRIGDPADQVGLVTEHLPGALSHLAGARVCCGSNDTWTAVAGLGALKPGRAYGISGSSEVFGLITDREVTVDGLITIPWGEDVWQIGGPGQNGANVLRWIVDLLDRRDLPFGERLGSLLRQPVSRRPILFHPYLHGERTPFWDRDLRASFLGVTASHREGDLVRAVMEGIAFVNRNVLERAEQAIGHPASEVRLAGGGARNPVWNQIRADILGRPVLASSLQEMGLAGCFAIARRGLGIEADVSSAAEPLEPAFVVHQPSRTRRARYDALYSLFKETHPAIAGASHRLADIGREPFEPHSTEMETKPE